MIAKFDTTPQFTHQSLFTKTRWEIVFFEKVMGKFMKNTNLHLKNPRSFWASAPSPIPVITAKTR